MFIFLLEPEFDGKLHDKIEDLWGCVYGVGHGLERLFVGDFVAFG